MHSLLEHIYSKALVKSAISLGNFLEATNPEYSDLWTICIFFHEYPFFNL